MLFIHSSQIRYGRASEKLFLSFIILLFLMPGSVYPQGNGRASTGTGGNHVIQGYVFFPSGRRAEGSIQIKLQSYNSGEITVLADTGGSFTFAALAPGSYTVVVSAGDEYEIARESVFIDNDANLSRSGIPAPSTSRRYTVMVHLQPKIGANRARASVLNAALAEVPEAARKRYEKGLEMAQSGDTLKAIDNLKAAVSLYPKFPLALNELGVQYLRLGHADKAVEALKTASELTPDAFTPRLNLGIALLEAKRFVDSEAQLREALKQNASAPTAHMYLGIALAHLGNYDEAEKELLRATEAGGGQFGLAHYYLGGLYWKKQNYGRAAEELETYLRLNPNAADAQRVRATIKDMRRLGAINKFQEEG
ncbi:MAG TPA: tetratricopeptide repeat protein [Pyrinomonadaceae bacterium]|nr:tetratricopeptide repeat protein [Pyrinomonadaceae bacterium]